MNIAELNDLDEVTRLEGFQTGTYLGMEIHDVPFEMVEYFDPCHPVLVGGIGLGKQNVGYVQATRFFTALLPGEVKATQMVAQEGTQE
ncbi:hypothetical protein CICLE_v10029939mg [Citrus x clementina]|uniref:Uncharacterized protein n=1 Tax=Citrus clementina TaxID=85681 RepID=V4SJW0_CITCL|nr:hypothetical protein CICLE_v10029939mg [Citrus x clementina]